MATSCAVVMDSDFGKYQPLEEQGASGQAGQAGSAGASGMSGTGATGATGGTGGICEPRVTINEIQTGGPSGVDDEFVELFNAGSCSAALDEYILVYRSASATVDHTISWTGPKGELKSQAFYLLAGKDYSHLQLPNEKLPFALAAGSAGLALRRGGTTVDKVGWGEATNDFIDGFPAPAPPSGQSIGRFPDGADTDHNGTDFSIMVPTPRAYNQAP